MRFPTSRRALVVAWSIVAVLALVQTARASVFMLDAQRAGWSVLPWDDFATHHSCYSAYYEAARLAPTTSNVYDPALYAGREIGPLGVDLYEYPPPFLVPFRLAVMTGAGFFTLRAVWFALDLAIVVAALLALAWHIGGREGMRAGMLALLVVLSLPVQLTLQLGNAHMAVIGLAVLAMIAFERGRPLLGGALLSYVVLSKLFPGVFVLLLLFERRWRDLAWTAACAGVWMALTVALLGTAPLQAFLTFQLQRIASGEAFPFLQRYPPAAAVNHSVYGIAIKLQHLGVPVGQRLAVTLSWLYTGVVVAAAWWVAQARIGSRRERGAAWLCLAILASLRSPFVPQEYAVFGPLWLLCLLAPRMPWWTAAAAWLSLNLLPPVDVDWPLPVLMAVTVIPQCVSFWLVWRGVAPARSAAWRRAGRCTPVIGGGRPPTGAPGIQ